jgi:hypothetical protein
VSELGYVYGWQATPMAAGLVLGISRRRRLSAGLSNDILQIAGASLMVRRGLTITDSDRRVRIRAHGGVAEVGGWPPLLCRSLGRIGSYVRWALHLDCDAAKI